MSFLGNWLISNVSNCFYVFQHIIQFTRHFVQYDIVCDVELHLFRSLVAYEVCVREKKTNVIAQAFHFSTV